MTGMYRYKESSGQPYGPTFMMGYGPGDVKVSDHLISHINNIFFFFQVERELDENGAARKGRSFQGHQFMAGMIQTDPIKREIAPLKTAYRWSCSQVFWETFCLTLHTIVALLIMLCFVLTIIMIVNTI